MNDLKMFKSEESVGDIQAIPSYEVAEMMGKKHRDVLRMLEGCENPKIIGIIPTLEIGVELPLSDYFIKHTYKDSMNREKECYECTKMGCEILANKLTGEKGILFTAKYVSKFNEMEKYIKEQEPKMPTTYKEALQHLLLQVEENERLQLENKEHQKTIGEMSPKAKYFDDLVDKDLLLNFRDTAKELEIKQKDFIEFLINNKYIFRDNGGNLKPYSTSISKGFFKIREFVVNNHAGTQTLITPKGREYFNKKIKDISK